MLDDLIKLGQQLGLFEGLKDRIVVRHDKAAKAFGEVLDELSKTYKALEDELTNYLSIWFDQNDQKGIAEQRRILIALEGGSIRVRMAKARGHCSKIDAIYNKYINKWLQRLDKGQHQTLRDIFNKLSGADSVFLKGIDDLAVWIEIHASQTLDALGLGDVQAANNQIGLDRKEVVDVRRELAKATTYLYQLNADFIKTSKAL